MYIHAAIYVFLQASFFEWNARLSINTLPNASQYAKARKVDTDLNLQTIISTMLPHVIKELHCDTWERANSVCNKRHKQWKSVFSAISLLLTTLARKKKSKEVFRNTTNVNNPILCFYARSSLIPFLLLFSLDTAQFII